MGEEACPLGQGLEGLWVQEGEERPLLAVGQPHVLPAGFSVPRAGSERGRRERCRGTPSGDRPWQLWGHQRPSGHIVYLRVTFAAGGKEQRWTALVTDDRSREDGWRWLSSLDICHTACLRPQRSQDGAAQRWSHQAPAGRAGHYPSQPQCSPLQNGDNVPLNEAIHEGRPTQHQ